MAIIFDHKPDSGTASLAKGEVVHEYQLIGTTGEFPNEESAAFWLDANVPLFFSGAWLQDIQIRPQGNGLFFVTCPYGPLPQWPGSSFALNFRTTGGTVHITSSMNQIARYSVPGGPAADPDRTVIGQDGSGADITVPVQMRSYKFAYDAGIITETAMDYWEDLTGMVNLLTWHGRPPGEVLFLGAEGDTTEAADGPASVTFNFAMSRNKTNQKIGAITGVNKQGHDLIDIHTKNAVIAGEDVQREKFIYVQRVYDRLSFIDYLGF